ncbi:Multidrug resistance-associated protein 1 [Coemansia sp. RSA 2681]|nr:Multidrug resistance-associated protein 1 [Coemansia sp. RSA 2681]
MKDVSFAQLRELGALQKLRKLTLDDLWSLPERYHLRNSFTELKINTNESFFLIRAILRMIWKPMIPIHIARTLFQLLPIFKAILNGYIYECLDSPDSNVYYKAYVAAVGLLLVEFLDKQNSHVEGYAKLEVTRVIEMLKLELTRQPLIHSGLKTSPTRQNIYMLDPMVNNVIKFQDVISNTLGTLATVLPIYRQVGVYAFVPLVVSLGTFALDWIIDRFVGLKHEWKPTTGGYYSDDRIEDIYFNVKTVKMFGWENMYLDPKLKKGKEYLNKLPWYAPLVRFGLMLVEMLRTLTTELSMYMTVAFYLQSLSASANVMTNSKLLEMAEHINTLRSKITSVYCNIKAISQAIYYANTLESLFLCETFDTISHVSLDKPNSVPSITMNNCRFRWGKKASILKKVSLNITGGALVAVVGKTGSGKSSLLLAMCREMELTKGSGAVVGRVGYLEQSPWIMNDTMRANIIFGREFKEEYFWKVVHACALTQDIESWPDKDLTLIGERGINISGGQRARLALARTVYSRADVYILDDPLSAVDAHVKRHILDNVILSTGLLGDKLRVVTTHTESMLPFCSQIVTVSDKTVFVVHQEPKEHTCIAPVAAIEVAAASDPTPDEAESDATPATSAAYGNAEVVVAKKAPAADSGTAKGQAMPEKHSFMSNARYVLDLCGWHIIGAVIITASFRPLTKFILDGYNIAALKDNAKSSTVSHDAVLWYLKICLLKSFTGRVLYMLEEYVGKLVSGGKVKQTIQAKFVRSLLYAPLSLVEKADRFKISSAYNEGSKAMARDIPDYLNRESAEIIESALAIWRSAQTTPQLMLIAPFVIWARTMANKLNHSTSDSLRDIKREVSSKHLQTSSIIEKGNLMIRLFGVESYYMSRHISDKNEGMKIWKPERALKFLSYLISNGIKDTGTVLSMFSVIAQSHLTKYKVTSGEMNVLQGDLSKLIYTIGSLVGVPGRLRAFSNEVGAFRQYSDIEPEAPYIVDDCRVPSKWPHSGNVEFKNLSVKYRADLDYALKNLNVTIRPGEKVGIVGRTGAGKSTLAKAIFRLLNKNVEGSIEIDGHDTAQFGVGDFRPKLGIIPQESAMFSGTVKRNLDPLQEFTIEDMWAALIKCDVAKLIKTERKHKPIKQGEKVVNASGDDDDDDEDKDKDGEDEDEKADRIRWENAGSLMRVMLFMFAKRQSKRSKNSYAKTGTNKHVGREDQRFSSGQRQLFSLCRLLMRKSKVLVLDEATADVDLETDRKMQELIRSEFSDCTVLTIAHRLDTIMNSDRVIIMEKGEIVEIGPPQELIASGGMFAELVKANEF